MRLGILIRDAEYRKALVEKLSSYDNDIFVNVIGEDGGDSSNCLLLTDIRPGEFDEKLLRKILPRTMFLISSSNEGPEDTASYEEDHIEDEPDYHSVFKYSSVNSLLSELLVLYNEWHGDGYPKLFTARTIAVLSESDSFSSDKCRALARQIIYRRGGRVLLMSLGYINDYGLTEVDKVNRFARLMYAVRTGRGNSADNYTYTDTYGVSFLMLPQGINPIAYLNEAELKELVAGLSAGFDTIILDICTCLRNENRAIIRDADRVICLESGRRMPEFSGIAEKETGGRVMSIRLTGETDEALAIDDCIKYIYGTDDHGTNKS